MNTLQTLYFSPTGHTKSIVEFIEKGISYYETKTRWDMTPYTSRTLHIALQSNDLLLMGIPVYSGRVPKTVLERLVQIKGNNTPAILVATYGNREYNDALLELEEVLTEKGFIVFGAAAFVTEHSVCGEFGKGRPDLSDWASITLFLEKINEKIKNQLTRLTVNIRGSKPYRPYKRVPLHPHGTSKCINCKACVSVCPVQAISLETPKKTNKEVCISCMACIKYCQYRGRSLYKIENFIAYRSLKNLCTERKEPTLFV